MGAAHAAASICQSGGGTRGGWRAILDDCMRDAELKWETKQEMVLIVVDETNRRDI
jgi:hypothetical protein